jgi:hypothetical protein
MKPYDRPINRMDLTILFNILSYDEKFKSEKVIEVIICLVIGVLIV